MSFIFRRSTFFETFVIFKIYSSDFSLLNTLTFKLYLYYLFKNLGLCKDHNFLAIVMEITQKTTWITPGYSQPSVRLNTDGIVTQVFWKPFSTSFLRNCYPNYLEDIVLTFNNIRKRFRSQKSEYRKNLLRRTILCMQNSTVSTHYGPCATPKCVTPKGVSNKIWLEDITRFIWRRTRRRFSSMFRVKFNLNCILL